MENWISKNIIALIASLLFVLICILTLYGIKSEEMKGNDWITTSLALVAIIISIISVSFAWIQTKIANRALVFSRSSASAAETSAKTAEMAVGEGYRPVLKLYTQNKLNSSPAYEYEYQSFDIFLQNIGNRPCKDITLTLDSGVLCYDNKHGKINIKPNIDKFVLVHTFNLDFLNVSKTLRVNKEDSSIIIKTEKIDTIYEFKINYYDLEKKNPYESKFKCTFRDLIEHY